MSARCAPGPCYLRATPTNPGPADGKNVREVVFVFLRRRRGEEEARTGEEERREEGRRGEV